LIDCCTNFALKCVIFGQIHMKATNFTPDLGIFAAEQFLLEVSLETRLGVKVRESKGVAIVNPGRPRFRVEIR